ncbi:MAG: histidine phosphatase family protein [Candidatus Paceibacterota bacterium]
MIKILLVRHGQDEDNADGILNGHRDMNLTKLGREQALIVAEKLKDDDIEIILSSPLKRAQETANIIADKLDITKIQVEELLKERDFGILTGKLFTDIPKLAKKILPIDNVNYFIEVEGAEDFPALYKRAQSFLEKVTQAYQNKVVVVVTHGDIGKIIRAAYHNWTWEEGLKTPRFENTGILHLKEKEDVVE